RLPGTSIQGVGGALDVGREDVQQVLLGADLLLRVRYPECLVEHWIELDLASEPVVVVLPALVPHEEPAVIHLATAAHYGDPRSLRDVPRGLRLVGHAVPEMNREFGESDIDPAGCSLRGGRPHLVLESSTELLCSWRSRLSCNKAGIHPLNPRLVDGADGVVP